MADFFGTLKSMKEGLAALKGVDSVTVSAIVSGGEATNSVVLQVTTAEWETFGKLQAVVYTDPQWIGALIAAGKLATWQTFTSQEIDFDLLPS